MIAETGVMGRLKHFSSNNCSCNTQTESSISSSAECGTENVDYSLRDPSWDMSHGNCTCDQNICLLNSLKVPERDDESTNVGGDVSGKPVQAVHPLPVRRTRAAQHLRNPPPPLQDLPSPDHPHPGASTGEDPCRCLDSPAGPVKRRSQSKRGYNLRPRKCTCMGLEEASCQSGTGTEAAPKLVVMAESSSTLTQKSVSVIKTDEETLGIKMEKNEDIPGVDSCSVDVKKSVAADQAPLAFVKENCPSMHMSQAEFLKDCGLVKAHSAVFVKQEVVPMELDLECQIVSVERPLPVLPRLSPNTRSLISSIKRETSDSPKAKRSLNCGLGVCNGGDSDNSSDSGMVEDSGKRSSIRGSLLCIALSSPLGQRVKKFTKADLVKPPVSDIERYCISIPEEDELRLRLRQKDQYPVRFKRRKNMVIDYSYTYKFNLSKRQWCVWRVCTPQEFNPICQAERYQIKKCLVRLSRLDEKQVRLKTVRKKTILNREVTIDNDLSIVRMDVPEQLYDEIQKIHMTESSSPEQPGPQPVPDSDSVRPVPSPSGIAGSSSSTGIRKGLPKHLRPCPMSKRKHQLTQEDSVEERDVESVLLSSEEDEPVEKQRVKDDEPQMESEDVQIISVTNISSHSIVIDLSDTEEQEGCTGSRITTSSDGAVPSTVVNESTSLPKESPVCGAAGVHNRVEESQVTATVFVATCQNSASVDAMCTFTVSTASADSRDSSAHLSPTVSQSVNANSTSTPSSAVPASQTTGPTSDRGLPSDGQRPDLSAQTQPVPGALTVPSGAQDMNVTSVSQISSGDSAASGSQHSTCLSSTPGSTTAQAQAGLKQNPGMQNVHEPQRPDAVHNLVDGTQPIVVTAPNVPAIPGSNTVPSWPVTPMMSSAQCVSVMSYPSSVQNVPMPMMSPNPPTALTLQAGVTQGQIMASRSDDPTSKHNLPPVLCSPTVQNVPTVQNSMFTADSFSTDSTPVLPNLPPLVNAASLPVVPASPTLTHSTLNMPPTQNADTASNTAILQANNPSAQNMPCVSSPSNIQTVAAVSSVQFAPPVPHSTSPQNTLQGPHTPLSPVEAPGTMQNTLGIAQPISVPSTPPLMGGAPPPQQVTQIPSRSVLMSPSQGMFPPTDVIPAQSVGQISHMQNTAAVWSCAQSSAGGLHPEQRPVTPQSLPAVHTTLSQTSPFTQANVQTYLPQNAPHVNVQSPVLQSSPFVPSNIQASASQSFPFVPGSVQTSLPQNSTYVPGNIETSVPQNSPFMQGNVQTYMPPNFSFAQGNCQTLPQNSYAQGSVPQNFPFAQGHIQTSVPQNSSFAQGSVQTSVPQNSPFVHGNIRTTVPQSSPFVQGNIRTTVPHNSPFVQGNIQTTVPQNVCYSQGNVQAFVPHNSSSTQSDGQTSVPQSAAQENAQAAVAQNPNYPQSSAFVPQNSSTAQGSVHTSVPQNSSCAPGNVPTSVAQSSPYVHDSVQASVSQNAPCGSDQFSVQQNSPFKHGNLQTTFPQNSPYEPGSDQLSLPQNSPYKPGSDQFMPQNSPYKQGSDQFMPQNSPYKQGSDQFVPQNSPYKQGSDQFMPQNSPYKQGSDQFMPQNSPYKQGSDQFMPQNSPYKQGSDQFMPQNSPYKQGSDQFMPQNSPYKQGSDQFVPQNSPYKQGNDQLTMPQNSPYKQGSDQFVPQNSPYKQGNVQTFVPQNSVSVHLQGNTQMPVVQNTAQMQGSDQMFTPNNSFQPQSNVQASVPQNFSSVQSNVQQTSVPQHFPYVAGSAQTCVPQNTPQMQSNFQTCVPQNSTQMQSNFQTSVPQSSPCVPGGVPTSLPQNFPQLQSNLHTSVPQNSSQLQGHLHTSVPQTFPQMQGNNQIAMPQNCSQVQGNFQTSVPPNSSYVPSNMQTPGPQNSPYVQGNARMSVPQNSPHIQNNAQMSSQHNPFFVPGNVQTSVPQSSPYAQGNSQVSLPQAPLHAQGNMQKPVPQNSSCVQGNLQSEVPQMFPNVQQGSVQMSQPQHSSVQGSVQTSLLQQSPYVQGSSQTNPQQPPPQAQMNSQTAGPQNFPCAQGNNIQMPTSHNTLTAQDTVQSSVPQVPGLAQGSIQTSVSPNSGYVQGSVPSNVSAISYNVQGGVQTSVAQNMFPTQGFPAASSNGQGQELAVPAPNSMPAQPQGSSGMAQSSQRVAQMCGHSETATRGGGGFPPAAQSQGSAGMMSVLQGNQSTSHQTAPGGETANQCTALSAQASPFQSTAQSQPAFVGGNVNPTNPPTPSHLPSNQNQSSAVLGNAPQGQNNPPVSVSNTQLNTSHVQNNPDSISNPQVNASHLQNNPVSISNIQNTPNLQSNPINISNAPMNAPPVQNNPAGSISSTESSSLVQITTSSAACGLGIQSSAPVQSVAPLQSSTGAQNVSANATGQPGQTGCVGQGTEPSVIVIDEESPEVLKQKLSVFNLIPNRTPSASPSKQMPATAMESTQNVPSAAATTTEDSSQLRISAVYGAAELASMFELASSSLSVSTPSTQPVERPTETQQAVGTVTEESWPQIQIGAVYGAAELANTNIAASLGLERPRAPYANIRGSGVAPPRFQAPYNTGYNAGYRTRQPRYDYRMQQSYVNTNRQRFTRPPQRHISVHRQQNYYRGRGAPYGGGGNPVRFGQGAPAAPRAPVNPQFVPEAVYEDDDCVEVICLDDD